MDIIVLTDSIHSKIFKEGKRYLPSNINLRIIEIPLKYPYTLIEKLSRSMLKSVSSLETIKQANAVISMSTLNALPTILFKKLHVKIPRHIMIDIGLPRILTPRNAFLKPFIGYVKKFFNNVDAVICFSRSQELYWRKVYGYEKIYFVPFGINPNEYQPHFKVGSYIFSGGRSDRDFDTLIKALTLLSKPIKAFIVYGRETVTFKNPILTTKTANKPYMKILYEIPHKAYIKLLQNAAFVVLPLRKVYYATGHTALLEAMATGKTVIVSRIPSILDYVEDWKTGITFEAGNYKDLKNKIEYLLEEPEEIIRIGINARKSIEQHFNLKTMLEKLISIATQTL